jgi:hypothetical protein
VSACCPQEYHDSLCVDLDTFLAKTFHLGVDAKRSVPGFPILLHATCPDCATSLSLPIMEVPGFRNLVKEQLEDDRRQRYAVSGEIETAEQHAARVIR